MDNKVKDNFNKYSISYDTNAIVQKEMSNFLMDKILNKRRDFDNIFEIGCGTGYFSSLIIKNLVFNNLFLNDISENMINKTEENIQEKENCFFLNCDFEKYQSDIKYDLICSNAVFQWFKDIKGAFSKISLMLNGKGTLAFSTFISETFFELDTAFGETYKQLNMPPKKHTLNFIDKETLIKYLNENGLLIDDISTKDYTFYFEHPKDFLKSVKDIGANSGQNDNTKISIMRKMFINYIDLFGNESGQIPATYKVFYCICRTSTI